MGLLVFAAEGRVGAALQRALGLTESEFTEHVTAFECSAGCSLGSVVRVLHARSVDDPKMGMREPRKEP